MKSGTAWAPCLCLVAAVVSGCGKKGPPLPPLVLLPTAPADFSVSRRAADAVVRFTVPANNSDGSTPSDLDRVEVYAFDGPESTPPEVVVRRGLKVGTILVNAPIDPDASQAEADEIKAKNPPGGLDRGGKAMVTDRLPASVLSGEDRPVRTYLAVGVNHRGRRGKPSATAAVPLGPAPAAPAAPRITFDEKAISLEWDAAPAADPHEFSLYRDDEASPVSEQPMAAVRYTDATPFEWGTARCYVLRTVRVVERVSVESEPSARACVTPVDRFPPAPPAGLKTIAGEASVDLIWDASPEPDLAGYLVLRAIAPQPDPEPISQTLVTETTFHDQVPSGSRVVYAVQAVDKAGNRSAPSGRAEENVR